MQDTKLKKKRSRGENWLKEDKIILKELIREKVDIIENKKLDTDTIKKKDAAWEDIRESFNYLSHTPRDMKQIKVQWKTLKIQRRRVKRKKEQERKEMLKGEPVESPASDNNVSVWLNECDMDSNECDSDSEIKNGIYDNSEVKSEKVVIAENEKVCRQELLSIHMKNAKLKTETLTLKKELLQLQIESLRKNM